MALATTHPNLALDSEVKRTITRDLLPLLRHTRQNRRTLREQWLRYYRIWAVTPDQEAYQGRVQNYIPMGRRICEQWTQRIMQALFPPEPFGVRALRQSLEKRVPLVKTLFQYFFDKHARVRRWSRPFVRQMVVMGTSPVKVVWKLAERDVPVLRDLYDMEGDAVAVERTIERVLDYIGPTFRPVDLFAFYVWPPVAMDIDEATIAFEDLLIDQRTAEVKGKKYLDPDDHDLGHEWENVDELLDTLRSQDSRDKVEAERRRLADKGFTHPTDADLPTAMQPLDVSEVVWRTDLDGMGEKRWLCVIGADDIPLRVQPVPWWDGKAHWLVGKFLEVENEFYGRSVLEMIDKLQYFTNDIANQASDALVWSMNPISVLDMFRMHDPNSLRMRPGAKWLGEPGGGEVKEPPKERAAPGFHGLGQMGQVMR